MALSLRNLSLGAALLGAALLAPSSGAKTLRTIAIDGNTADWAEVLLDRDQKVADRSQAQGDPDNPPQAQRDLRGVSFTWDATNLYLYFSRTGAGTNSFSSVFYMDLNHDGIMSAATDRVAVFRFSGSSFGGFEYDRYTDGGTPDPLRGDGSSMPGGLGTTVTTAGGNAAVDTNGIGVEASVTWAALGVPAGTPMFIQPALASSLNLPTGIQDNADPLDTFLVGVLLTGGGTQGSAPGGAVEFPHAVTNDGTATDVIDLFFRTRLGFAVEVHSDPNGDGDPADGAVLGRDSNGDGDMTDTTDIPPSPAVDANRNGFVDGGTLAAGARRSYVLRIGVPPRQALGTEEVVTLFAASGYKPSVRVQTEDRVRVGLLTITPERSLISAAATQTSLSHELCNDSGSARVINLEADSLLGWTAAFWTDPDGNGDASDGAPIPDGDGDGRPDMSLPDGACAAFVVLVSVPAGAPVGIRDDIDLTADDSVNLGTAFDTIRVVPSTVEVQPDRTLRGQPGRTVFTVHEVVNASGDTDTFSLSATSTLGSVVATLNDPNDDGDPDGSSVVTTTGPVPPDGGRFPEITRIRVPGSATHGQIDTIRTRATSAATGSQDVATDTLTVFGMLTYSDPLFARPATDFYGQCSTVYVLAFRSGGTYRFAWFDSAGALRRTSPDVSPYSDGSIDDFYDGGSNPMLGTWTVRLQQRQGGSNYVDVGPSGTVTFEMRDLVSAGARVALNDTGADLYNFSGDALVAYADLANPTAIDVMGSSIEHVAFFDTSGDGVPTAGEEYVRADGSVVAWSAGLVTSRRTGLEVYSGETVGDRFVTQPVTYTQPGRWTLRTTWVASCGFLISARTASFTVGCLPPPTFGGLVSASDVDPCETTGIRLSWDPVTDWGLGGSGTYAVYRSTDPGFTPDAATLLVSGLTSTTHLDSSPAPGTAYSYVVRAENSGNCSDGPNNSGLMDSNFVHVEATDDDFGVVPAAAFSFSGPACVAPGTGALVRFTDESAGPAWTWSWDFDGDLAEDSGEEDPAWTFPSAGDWLVTLTIESPCGVSSTQRTVTVGDPPTAAATASRTATCTDEAVDFDGSASMAAAPFTLVAWAWDFDGDGLTDSTQADPPPHAYASPGSYTASLRVTDSLGCEAVTTIPVRVHSELVVNLAAVVPVIDHCTGDVSVTASASGGQPPYAYSWDVLTDDGSGTGSARLPFGTTRRATLTVTDAAGCSVVSTSVDLTVNPQLTLALGAVDVDSCTGDVTLPVVTGGGDGRYVLTFTNLGPGGAARLGPGTYTERVTLTDGAGCSVTESVDFEVPNVVSGDFASAVSYLGPGAFRAELAASATSGAAPFTFTWDLGADGTTDGSGPTIGFDMGAGQTVTVDLTILDANGCSVVVRRDVSSAGCPVDTPVSMVKVRKGAQGIVVTWDASVHPCHDRYDVLVALDSARPAVMPGTWPTDPAFTSVRGEDADGSGQNESLTLLDWRDGSDLYILVRDGGTDGTWGPVESYGNTGVTP